MLNTENGSDLQFKTGQDSQKEFENAGTYNYPTGERKFDFSSFVPDTYREKEWVKNIAKSENPREEFFKQYENAQSLIGQKQQIKPLAADATPEQRKEFYKALGVPEDIKAYEVKPIQWDEKQKAVGDYLTATHNEPFLNDLRKMAQRNGLTPEQFQRSYEDYNKIYAEHFGANIEQLQKDEQEHAAAERANDVNFDKLMDVWHGEKKFQVLERGKNILDSVTPPEFKPILNKFSNEQLAALTFVTNMIDTKYLKEDGRISGSATLQVGGSKSEFHNQIRKMMENKAYTDQMHPQHMEVRKKVNEAYRQLHGL